MRWLLLALMVVVSLSSLLAVTIACDTRPELENRPGAQLRDGSVEAALDAPREDVDLSLPPIGVPDKGRTAALVLLSVGENTRCSAALIASDVAILPAHCVTSPDCSLVDVRSLSMRSGDDDRKLLARVREVVLFRGVPEVDAVGESPPAGAIECSGDTLAGVVLSEHADGISPFAVRARGGAAGEFVRMASVEGGVDAGARRIRDHDRIAASTSRTLSLAIDDCASLSGAVVIDEATGELIGVGGASECASDATAFVQLDAMRGLISQTMARAAAPLALDDGGVEDAGVPRKGKAVKPTLDLGDPCESADDCAAGVCIRYPGSDDPSAPSGYCSRTCGAGDRCPSGMRCERGDDEHSVCGRSS